MCWRGSLLHNVTDSTAWIIIVRNSRFRLPLNENPWTDQSQKWHNMLISITDIYNWCVIEVSKSVEVHRGRASVRVSPYVGQFLNVWTFLFLSSCFSDSRTANTGLSISTYNIPIDVVWPKDVPFGISSTRRIGEVKPQNPYFWAKIGICSFNTFVKISAKPRLITINLEYIKEAYQQGTHKIGGWYHILGSIWPEKKLPEKAKSQPYWVAAWKESCITPEQ
jgi:hypothetical protein